MYPSDVEVGLVEGGDKKGNSPISPSPSHISFLGGDKSISTVLDELARAPLPEKRFYPSASAAAKGDEVKLGSLGQDGKDATLKVIFSFSFQILAYTFLFYRFIFLLSFLFLELTSTEFYLEYY